MGTTTVKGNLGEAMIMADLIKRGYRVALPIGNDLPFDLILIRVTEEKVSLERVQCKAVSVKDGALKVSPRSASSWVKYKYTENSVDWIGVYAIDLDRCFYIPAAVLGVCGRGQINLRVTPAKNNQICGVLLADDFSDI